MFPSKGRQSPQEDRITTQHQQSGMPMQHRTVTLSVFLFICAVRTFLLPIHSCTKISKFRDLFLLTTFRNGKSPTFDASYKQMRSSLIASELDLASKPLAARLSKSQAGFFSPCNWLLVLYIIACSAGVFMDKMLFTRIHARFQGADDCLRLHSLKHNL